MSNSSEFSESAMTTTTLAESSFSKTCNRLREYLKENGSIGDISLGIALATDNNGFGKSSEKSQVLPRSLSSMNLFPQRNAKAEVSKVGDNRCVALEPKTAQMTIFYSGQVIALNDMPAGKAMEIIRLASIASCQASGIPTTPSASGPVVTPQESFANISSPVLGEIPIARKQSLARFLEKRKDRIMARSPYFVKNSTKGAISASTPVNKSCLGLAGL